MTAKSVPTIPNIPAVLAFRSRTTVSDATMHVVREQGSRAPVTSFLHGQRMPFSNESTREGGDAVSGGEKTNNLMQGYRAKMPDGAGTLEISFSVAYRSLATGLEACDDKTWFLKCQELGTNVANDPSVRFVAECLAYNILSGVWGWRNREEALALKVTARFDGQVVNVDNVIDWPLYAVRAPLADGVDPKDSHKATIAPLADRIHSALSGKAGPVAITVTGQFTTLPGGNVWPSQLRLDGVKERTFYTFGKSTTSPVGMTAEKIGNALRTFDRFHQNQDFNLVVPVESLGGSLRVSANLRGPAQRISGIMPRAVFDWTSLTAEERIYVAGWLLRGGVLTDEGAADRKKAEAEKKKAAKQAAKQAQADAAAATQADVTS